MKKIVSLLLVLGMIGSLAACGNTNPVSKESETLKETTQTSTGVEDSQATSEEVKEPVKITVYPVNGSLVSGEVGDWAGEYLLENGIILEVWAHSDEKLNTMLASGDLPDIIYLPSGSDFKVISESGMLLDLEGYMDKMPSIANNEKIQNAIAYTKEYVTDGTLTMLPLRVGEMGALNNTDRLAIKLNWEVYEKIGCPEFSNLEELIPILKQMQEAYPQTADGVKTYAMHMFSDSDGEYFNCIRNVIRVLGYTEEELPYFMEYDAFNDTLEYILEDDSMYKYALRFYNQLYREGLLDPDSISAERLTQNSKIGAGGALAGWASVPGYEKNGYYPVWFDDFKTYLERVSPFGDGSFIAVNAKTENLDTVLEFLDMIANPDEILPLLGGPEGEMWEINAAGEVVLTQKGIDFWVNGVEATFANGTKYNFLNTPMILHQGEKTSHGVNNTMSVSEEVVLLKNSNELMQRWQEHNNYDNFYKMAMDKGALVLEVPYTNLNKFTALPSDDMSIIMAAAKDELVAGSWKMVYAKTDAEFEQIWDDTIKSCEKLGIKDIMEWRKTELEKAADIKASILK